MAGGLAIGGGEERDVVAAGDEFVDEQLHQQLDAAVGAGGMRVQSGATWAMRSLSLS